MHLLHVGYVGLAANVHYDAVVNFATGWFGIRLLGGACAPEDRPEVAVATERPEETDPAPVIRHAVAAATERPEETKPAPVIGHDEPTTTQQVFTDAPRTGRNQHVRTTGVGYVERATD